MAKQRKAKPKARSTFKRGGGRKIGLKDLAKAPRGGGRA